MWIGWMGLESLSVTTIAAKSDFASGIRFFRRNFPNIEEKFSLYGGGIFIIIWKNFPNLPNELS